MERKYPVHTPSGRCIFCAFTEPGGSPPGMFWENEYAIAFLALYPNTPGQTVIATREHYPSDVLELPTEVYHALYDAAQTVNIILKRYYPDAGRIVPVAEGNGVDHAHLKLFPMHGTTYLRRGEWRQFPAPHEHFTERYEGYISTAGGPRADECELAQLAEKLRRLSR